MLSVDHVGTVILLYRLQSLEKCYAIANMLKGVGAVHTSCEKDPLARGFLYPRHRQCAWLYSDQGKVPWLSGRARIQSHALGKTQLFRG